MPIYEYRCESCGHQLEVIQKMSDPPLSDCPECGAPKLKKLLSAAGFRLKGGGWYETDFKQHGTKKNLHDPLAAPAKAEAEKPKTADGKASAEKVAKPLAPKTGGQGQA